MRYRQNQENNLNKRKARIPEAYDFNERLINKIKHPRSGRADPGSSESDIMSV